MSNLRAFIKHIFYKTRLVPVLDYMLYQAASFRNRKKNRAFRKANPDLVTPPDYFLYETYRLDYEQFFEDSKEAAKEIAGWTKGYRKQQHARILDWGCGVSRIATNIDSFTDATISVYACDINARMIEFDRTHYRNVSYSIIPYSPPVRYESSYFNFVYALSVFTHIEVLQQESWIKEIHRILEDNGLFLFTTHGSFYDSKLLPKEKQLLYQNGAFTKSYQQKGHRMMSTYNTAKAFRSLLQHYFDILEFHEGTSNLTKMGGQDLWIVRKVPVPE